jgi:hypothetical protein
MANSNADCAGTAGLSATVEIDPVAKGKTGFAVADGVVSVVVAGELVSIPATGIDNNRSLGFM